MNATFYALDSTNNSTKMLWVDAKTSECSSAWADFPADPEYMFKVSIPSYTYLDMIHPQPPVYLRIPTIYNGTLAINTHYLTPVIIEHGDDVPNQFGSGYLRKVEVFKAGKNGGPAHHGAISWDPQIAELGSITLQAFSSNYVSCLFNPR